MDSGRRPVPSPEPSVVIVRAVKRVPRRIAVGPASEEAEGTGDSCLVANHLKM
jgi:hypothetical protein